MKHIFLLLLISLSTTFLTAQSEVSIQIELLTPDIIGGVILEQDSFIEWIKLVNEEIKTECAKESGDKDLIVSITIHSHKDATVELFSLPEIAPSIIKALQKKIASHKSPRTKFNEYSLIIGGKINEGAPSDSDLSSVLVLPYDRKIEAFKALSLVDKQRDIEYWMRKDILPILAHLETNVDSAYLGVLSVGNVVKEGDFLQRSTETVTDENPDYWRATMEMSRGNQLIPFTKACMFLANGEFDKAKRLLDVIGFFYDKSTLPSKFDREISDKLNLYMNELGEEIEKGIALHDAGKFKDAIKLYKKLLKDFSKSAWLNYELYFSKAAASGDFGIEGDEWKNAKETIYGCDPMYPLNAQAKSGKEGYRLFRRQEINGLFSSDDELKSDFTKYAYIAFDLENYGFAAQIYWLALSHLAKEDYDERDLLAHFLYCIDKLGDTETIDNFKDDYTAKFAEIEAERLELMRNSFMYKAFKKEE